MKDKVNSLINQNTYNIINKNEILNNHKALRGKWVFKKKFINNPNIIKPHQVINKNKNIKYKTRWVIQGFN